MEMKTGFKNQTMHKDMCKPVTFWHQNCSDGEYIRIMSLRALAQFGPYGYD